MDGFDLGNPIGRYLFIRTELTRYVFFISNLQALLIKYIAL